MSIERRYSSNPRPAVVAGAFALYLARKSCRLSNGERLQDILKSDGVSRRIANFVERAIGSHWGEYASSLSEFSEDELADYFATACFDDTALRTPPSLAELVLKLFDLRPGDTVLDLGSGTGDFLKAAWFALWDVSGSDDGLSVTGVEVDADRIALSEIRAFTDGMRPTVIEADVFDFPASRAFSKVFSLPPLGARARDIGLARIEGCLRRAFPGFPQVAAGPADWFFAARAAAALADGGRAIAILPEGALFGKTGAACRRFLLANGMIECVVALPPRLFPTSDIASALVVFGRGAKSVRFIDATGLFIPGRRQNTISKEQIREIASLAAPGVADSPRAKSVALPDLLSGDCELSPARILDPEPAISNSVPFGSVLKTLRRGAALDSSDLDKYASQTETQYLYAAPGDIQDGVLASHLAYLSDIPGQHAASCAQDGDLLISRIGPQFKVAVAEIPAGKVLLPGGNLFVATPDPARADPWYLKAFLDSPAGARLLARRSTGKTVKSLPLGSLADLPIPLPSIDGQRAVAARARRAHADVKAARDDLETALARLRGAFDSTL